MRLTDLFVLVRSCNDYSIPYDFYISRYPVALADNGQTRIGTGRDTQLYRAPRAAATRFCDHLSARNHLPLSYSGLEAHDGDLDGLPLDEALRQQSFRLPTPEEWNYAAHGWSGARTGDYFAIQKQLFRIPFRDYPVSAAQQTWFNQGYSRVDELVDNPIGLRGMNGYAREWCSPAPCRADAQVQGVRWEEYASNYDNDIGYQTTTFQAPDDAVLPFRVVLPSRK